MILNSPYITGSLTVTGNITASGGITISGSISSASYAANADRVDGLDSTSFVFTSSYVVDSGSMSSRVTTIESKYATTGSNIFQANQTICGNLTTTGTITAQTINVQQVTSSVVYSCGSNIFGCAITDTQQFTGSMFITGSTLTVTGGTICTTGNTCFGGMSIVRSCIGIGTAAPSAQLHVSGANNQSLFLASSPVSSSIFFISGSGNIGIGNTTPEQQFDILTSGADPTTIAQIRANRTGYGNVRFQLTTYAGGSTSTDRFSIQNDSGTKYLNILWNGNVGIGATSPVSILHLCCATPIITLEQTTGNSNQGINFNSGATTYGKITNNSATGIMTIQNGNNTGDGYLIRFITDGTERLRIGTTGISCFACQICAPAMDIMPSGVGVSTLGGIMRVVTTGTSTGIAVGQSNSNRYTHFAANDIQVFNDDFFLSTRCAFPLSIGTCYTARLTFAATGVACFSCQVCAPFIYVNGTAGNISADTGNGTLLELYGGSITGACCGVGIGFTRNGSQLGYIKAARENATDEASYMIFATQTSVGAHPERMRITSGGNVGIGTQTPSGLGLAFVVSVGGYPDIIVERTGANARKWGMTVGSDGSYLLRDYTSGNNRLTISTNGNSSFNGKTISSFTSNPGNVNSGATTTYTITQVAGEFQSAYLVSIVGLYTSGGANQNGYASGIANFFTDGSVAQANMTSINGNGWSMSVSATTGGSFTITFTNSASTTMSNIAIRILKLNMTGGD
jgi:hypothetical protein